MLNKKRKMKGKEKRNGRKYFSYTNDLSTVVIVGTVREGPKVGERPKVDPWCGARQAHAGPTVSSDSSERSLIWIRALFSSVPSLDHQV
jgi:hypothetical protein